MEYRKLSELVKLENNPRKISDQDFERLKDSIKKFGVLEGRPFLVSNRTGEPVIIGGNQRYEACKALGIDKVPVHILEDLTEEEEREIVIRDNVSNGQWDWEMLECDEWDSEKLEDWGVNLPVFETVPEEEQEENFEEKTPENPITMLGDLYEIGEHRLLCGDSTDITQVEKLMNGYKADFIFTDPPYGISFEDSKGNGIKNDDLKDDDLLRFNDAFQSIAFNVSKDNCFMIVWQSPRLFHLMNFFGRWRFFRLITLYKSNRISFPHGAWINKTEPGLVFVKGSPKISKEKYTDDCFVYTHDKESHDDSNVGHPTPKPPILAENNILACTNKGEIVLDLFLGSGTTMVGSHRNKRKCYGMEIDPKYCDVIVERMIKLDPSLEVKRNGEVYVK